MTNIIQIRGIAIFDINVHFCLGLMWDSLTVHRLKRNSTIGPSVLYRSLVDLLDTTTARYKMEIGPDKTKVMINNPTASKETR